MVDTKVALTLNHIKFLFWSKNIFVIEIKIIKILKMNKKNFPLMCPKKAQ